MAAPVPRGPVLATPRVARLLGIFHVLFGSAILLLGLCSGVFMLSSPLIAGAMKQVEEAEQKRVAAFTAQQLKALDDEGAEAKTAEQKEDIARRKREVVERPKPAQNPMTDMMNLTSGNPTLNRWYGVEIVSGLALNLAMIISGVGLLGSRRWAWKLALWTGLLKVLRLTALYLFFVMGIVPGLSQKLGEAVSAMTSQQAVAAGRPAGAMPPPELFAKVYAVTYSVMGIGMIVVGSVYPLISVWFLTRPGVRAACLGGALVVKPAKDDEL